jgi:hypothetical protein
VEHGGQTLQDFWRRAVRLAQLLVLAGAAALYFGLENGGAAGLGLVLGGAASLLRYRLRYRALLRMSTVGPLVRVRLISYALNGLVLAVAFAFRGTISPWSTAAGLLVMNVSVIATELVLRGERRDGSRVAARSGS